jgi:LPS-assembly lipoprotein
MSSFRGETGFRRTIGASSSFRQPLGAALVVVLMSASGCTWQPLYSSGGQVDQNLATSALSQVSVGPVETRQGQQVRNHLIFLLQGGRDQAETRYRLQMRITDNRNEYAAVEGIRDFTAGSITITASYDLIDITTNTRVSGGSRFATATYDRTSQNFANERAARDAENRAARELAEQIRLAIAADLKA